MGEERLRVARLGLIGVGAWGRRYLDTIGRREDCRVVAFARSSSRPLDGSGAGLSSARQCADWQELLGLAAAGELDGVVVASTPAVQAEVAQAGVSAGVPLLVEKPLGFSADVCRDLLRQVQARSRRVPFLVDYIHLWSPAYRQLKQRVADLTSAGGAISAVTSRGCNWGPFRGWSSLFDYGPHDLAMVLDLLGGGDVPLQLVAAEQVSASQDPAAELFEVSLRSGDVSVNLTVGNGSPQKERQFTVVMRQGARLTYDDTQPPPGKLQESGSPVPVAATSPLDNVLSDFLRQIASCQRGDLSSQQAEASLGLSVRVTELLTAIARSARPVPPMAAPPAR